MPCYTPLAAQLYVSGQTNKQVTKVLKRGHPDANSELPCGKCIGCRLDKARDWALRCYHETTLYGENNAFITLTYDEAHLPEHSSLRKTDFQKFIRKLRKPLRRASGKKIRYFMCGEYGKPESEGGNERPHYHAMLFNYQFPDRQFRQLRNGNPVFTSELLSELWHHGSHEIGSATFQSAGYTARYILKKQNGQPGEVAYAQRNRIPPYTACSLRPGIGYGFYQKHKHDIFPRDYMIAPNGRQVPVPKYYRRLLKDEDTDLFEELKAKRLEKAENNPDNTQERLAARHTNKLHSIQSLKRTL